MSGGAFLLDHRRTFWLHVVASAIAVAAMSSGIVIIMNNPVSVSSAATFPVFAFQVYFAAYWLVAVLSQRPRSTLAPLSKPEQPIRSELTAFVGYSLLLAFAFTMFLGPVAMVMLVALSGFSGVSIEPTLLAFTPATFTLRCVIIGPFFIAAFCRLLLVFPARAAGEALTLRGSWALARGIGWPLFGTQLICAIIGLTLFTIALTVPWSLVDEFSSNRLLGVSLISLAVTVASAIHIALAGFCLAELYTFRRFRGLQP